MSARRPADIVVVATGGAGGDLEPLVAAALALRNRGHVTRFVDVARRGAYFSASGWIATSSRPSSISDRVSPTQCDATIRLP